MWKAGKIVHVLLKTAILIELGSFIISYSRTLVFIIKTLPMCLSESDQTEDNLLSFLVSWAQLVNVITVLIKKQQQQNKIALTVFI